MDNQQPTTATAATGTATAKPMPDGPPKATPGDATELGRGAPEHPLFKLCFWKSWIVIQQKGGNIITGRAKWFRKGFLKLEPAKVQGLNRQVTIPWILVDNQTIAHIHPAPLEDRQKFQEGADLLSQPPNEIPE